MRRLVPATVIAATVVALVLALAPVALGDDRDPRCGDWERNGAPPGTNMALMCPAAGPLEVTVDLGAEPLFPYLVALVVVAAVLVLFGVVAMRFTAPSPRSRPRAAAFWTCASCGATNQPARAACFSCQSSRANAAPVATAAPEAPGAGAP
jgi:hypothetical protein